jgi:S-adenosylmethionine synthetase
MMFGYATKETENYMPLALDLSHAILQEMAAIRHNESDVIAYLRPDAKSQVTIEYSDDNVPQRIDTIVVSTQHDDFATEPEMLAKIKKDIVEIVIPRVKAKLPVSIQALFTNEIQYHINPTGKFVIGGPQGDAGLTGRKIIVDTYGGASRHGGGAFSGKDPSKVDRSAAYAMRWVAKNVVASGAADRAEVQVAYAIGVANPVGIYLETFGTEKVDTQLIESAIRDIFDLRPRAIVESLDLLRPVYAKTAAYGHFGRELPEFTWEKLNRVEELRSALKL